MRKEGYFVVDGEDALKGLRTIRDVKTGGAIPLGFGKSDFGITLTDTTGKPVVLEDLSQDRLKKLITAVSETRKKKYGRNNTKKYGNLNKGFTDEELNKFFKFCFHPKTYACFYLMANLGLRVGEVVNLKLSDLDFYKKTIRIETEKAKTIDYLHLHEQVRILLTRWVRKFQKEIEEHDGFLFFSEIEGRQHISKNWLPKIFREVAKIAKLDDIYGIADDLNNYKREGKPDRKLYRLTTHSLRHYFITKVYANCKDPLKTQKLARHCEFKSTETYIHLNQDDLDKTIQKVFGNDASSINTDEMKEFMTFFKLWKGANNGS